MKEELHLKQRFSLRERIEFWAEGVRDQASLLPRGRQQEALLKKARRAEAASRLDAWLTSRGLQAPD